MESSGLDHRQRRQRFLALVLIAAAAHLFLSGTAVLPTTDIMVIMDTVESEANHMIDTVESKANDQSNRTDTAVRVESKANHTIDKQSNRTGGTILAMLATTEKTESANRRNTTDVGTKKRMDVGTSRDGTSADSVGTPWNDTSPPLQLASEFDQSSNIAEYTWENRTSRRWIPPNNLPHLTRRDMLQIFLRENTVWIGDSTARQDYQTLYWLLRETNQSASMDLGSLDFAVANPQHKTLLEQYKNINKMGKDFDYFWCHARRERKDKFFFANHGMVGDQTQCFVPGETNKTIPPLASTGKLDYAIARNQCFDETRKELIHRASLLEELEYSAIVISVGPYQFEINNQKCQNRPSRDIVYDMLDFLRDEIASPERTVIWKLHGPGRPQVTNFTEDGELAEAVRNWFDNHTQTNAQAHHGGMELADFRYAVRERTNETHRIWGDHPMHWGLEARLLSIDLVARIIARKNDREGTNLNSNSN